MPDAKTFPAKARAEWPYGSPQVVPGSPFQSRRTDDEPWINGIATAMPPMCVPVDVRFEHSGSEITHLEFDHDDGYQIRVHIAFIVGLILEFSMNLIVKEPRANITLVPAEGTG